MKQFILRISHLLLVWRFYIVQKAGLGKSTVVDYATLLTYPTKELKIYTYDIPRKYRINDDLDLSITHQTFEAISYFFKFRIGTTDPSEADYFFVPINLHKYQLKNKNPNEILKYLTHLSAKKDHLIISTGDFSQRSGNNRYGRAYRQRFTWLKDFKLLALESTSDLIKHQDIGIIPYNTLVDDPLMNHNHRPYLYSFLGTINHVLLPKSHVRHNLKNLNKYDDCLIAQELDGSTRAALQKNFKTKNDFELVSRNSIFTLAPAGYGKWTYRFFQAITWGSIPVIISDSYIKPFNDRINYDDFCITIKESDFDRVDEILRSIDKDNIKKMQRSLELAQEYFTKRGFFELLTNALIDQKNY